MHTKLLTPHHSPHTALESSGQATRGAETPVQPHSNLASEEENEAENEKDDGEGEYEERGQGNEEEEEEEEDEENVPENTERSRTKRVIVQLKVRKNRTKQNRVQ
jgi:hypothetical protein